VSGLTSPPRAGAGPLAGHTPHRGSGSGTAPRPSSPPPDYRPNPSTPPPLKLSDYVSPAGLRQPAAQRPGVSQGPVRRTDEETQGGGYDASRRDQVGGARRPLPQVAALAPQ